MDMDEKAEEDPDIAYEEHILDHCALDSAIAAAESRVSDHEDDDTYICINH